MLRKACGVGLALAATLLGAPSAAPGGASIGVHNAAEFGAAVSALRSSGGTIRLLPGLYRGTLVVPSRSGALLNIVGSRGVRVEGVLFDHTQRVSLGDVTLFPRTQNAPIDVNGSSHVDLHDLVVTARGTRMSSTINIPDSSWVTLRDSDISHCGDHVRDWVNCLFLGQLSHHVTIEDNDFHDCYGCDFIHGRFGSDLKILGNRMARALPCHFGGIRCIHQDLIEMFGGQGLRLAANQFGIYEHGGAQVYLTGPLDHATVVNNVFIGSDPRVPNWRCPNGLIVGGGGKGRLPYFAKVINNTLLTGRKRWDDYDGSIRMNSRYGSVPVYKRPLVANNVFSTLVTYARVCNGSRAAIANVIEKGDTCRGSNVFGDAQLDARGRPSADSTLVIGKADPRFAPATDITGRARDGVPDIGAYEYRSGT